MSVCRSDNITIPFFRAALERIVPGLNVAEIYDRKACLGLEKAPKGLARFELEVVVFGEVLAFQLQNVSWIETAQSPHGALALDLPGVFGDERSNHAEAIAFTIAPAYEAVCPTTL
jgi:hypothetical protein